MTMSYFWAQMGRSAPMILRNSMVIRKDYMTSAIFPKPMSRIAAGPLGLNTWPVACASRGHKSIFLQRDNFSYYGYRFVTEKSPDHIPSPPNQSPFLSDIPAKKQLEKKFFRVVAFFWDNGSNLLSWSSGMLKTYIIELPSVQFYWKRFHDKMEQSKKRDAV